MKAILFILSSWAVSPGAKAAAAGRNLAGIPCGKPGGGSDLRQGRIMGGTAANIIEFPYAVSLQTAQGVHFCGGSLVTFIKYSYRVSLFLKKVNSNLGPAKQKVCGDTGTQ